MFTVWFLQSLVFGGIVLCSVGVIVLLTLFYFDSKDKRIW